MNLKIVLSFDGTEFYGWQYQPNKRTVSGELIKVIKNLVEGEFKLIGCGRTDAGVHAINYVASLRIHGRLRVNLRDLRYKLNRMLPDDIYIKHVDEVDERFNARFSATSKIYRYVFFKGYDPLIRYRAFFINQDFDLERINESLKVFLGKHDFYGFSSEERENRICEIYDISLSKVGRFYHFEIEANRFIRKMVRFIASSIVKLQMGHLSVEDIKIALRKPSKIKNLDPLPPYGLYLLDVKY